MENQYTHVDKSGMKWRFVGSRPVSELADKVMEEVMKEDKKSDETSTNLSN